MDIREYKSRLAALLVRKSYREGDFVLSSGQKSNYYFDCRQTALHSEGSYLLGQIFYYMIQRMNPLPRGVAGMTLGADPLVTAVTVVSYLQGRPLPGILVRKKAKGYGTDSYLEGQANFSPGDRVCVLEDVITTGGSVLTACIRLKEAGYRVDTVLSVLDRKEGGEKALNAQGYAMYSIFTPEDLADAAR